MRRRRTIQEDGLPNLLVTFAISSQTTMARMKMHLGAALRTRLTKQAEASFQTSSSSNDDFWTEFWQQAKELHSQEDSAVVQKIANGQPPFLSLWHFPVSTKANRVRNRLRKVFMEAATIFKMLYNERIVSRTYANPRKPSSREGTTDAGVGLNLGRVP